MLGSPILDLAIGMAFVYLLLSLIASVVQEFLATVTQARAANLARGLHSLFSGDPLQLDDNGNPGKQFVKALYDHGLIRGLYSDPEHDRKGAEAKPESLWTSFRLALRKFLRVSPPGDTQNPHDLLLPAYIPARTFSAAMIDLLNDGTHGWDTLASIDAHLRELARRNQLGLDLSQSGNPLASKAAGYENKAVEALQALLTDAGGRMDKFQSNLENWYNDSMDRVSGWYKKYVQYVLICVGLLMAVSFNVDSVRVAKTLWFDHDARTGLANAASEYIKDHPDFASTGAKADPTPDPDSIGPMKVQLERTVKTFNRVSQDNMLPVGWHHGPTSEVPPNSPRYHYVLAWILAILGWGITAGALSFGAPFWFDMLNKIMVVRGTVKPSEKSPNEGSKS